METTQYLYEYQDGNRSRNIGFMKIDNQMDKSTIQIYARPMDEVKGILFQRPNGETYIGAWEAEAPPQPRVEIALEPAAIEEDVTEYITPSNVTYEKIKRQDLSRLPRKEWRLANNSFLLHGFYNYHHLLYIEEDGQIWIGVPGIYHPKEKMAANSFGFPEFKRISDVDVELDEQEKNTLEDFGYWCRQIPNS